MKKEIKKTVYETDKSLIAIHRWYFMIFKKNKKKLFQR